MDVTQILDLIHSILLPLTDLIPADALGSLGGLLGGGSPM